MKTFFLSSFVAVLLIIILSFTSAHGEEEIKEQPEPVLSKTSDEEKFNKLNHRLHHHHRREHRQKKIVKTYEDYFDEQLDIKNEHLNPPLLQNEKQFLVDHTNNHSHHHTHKNRIVHKCMHDEDDHAKIIARHLSENTEAEKRLNAGARLARFASPLAVEGIRIVYSDADLNNTDKYCTAAGETKPDFRGGTATCREEDVLTDEKRLILTTKILPGAIGLIKEMLAMERLVTPIIVPQTACSGLGYTIPASHSTTGVSDAEYVLYVSAGRTPDGVIAFAGGCGTDAAGRLIYGRANFGPEYLRWDDNNPAANNDMVKTAIHEVWHALGYSYQVFNDKGLTQSVSNVRGKSVTVHNGPIAAARARDFFGCSTLNHVELEDEGGSGSALSHPDKRLFPHDFMAASGGTLISTISIAMLADLGYYTALWGQVQNSTFGQGAGCSFVSDKCNLNSGGRDKYFCFDSSLTDVCNYDYTAAGYCGISDYTSDLPTYFQYFSGQPRKGGYQFHDYCPVVNSYSNRICNGERVAAHIDYVLGFTFTRQSRCFKTENVIRSGISASNLGETRCLVSQCVDTGSGVAVQFKINGSGWQECSTEGQRMSSLPGYDGTVICPTDFASFCDYYDKVPAPPDGFPEDFAGTGASTGDDYGQVPTNPGAIVWIRGDLVFTGTGWGNLSDVVPPECIEGLQKDLAYLIGVTVREAFITSAKIEPHPDTGTSERVLHVYYYLTNTDLTIETVNNRLENVRVKKSTAWLTRTRTAYAEASGHYDSPVLYSHREDYELSYLERLFMDLGVGPFSGVVVAGFILACVIVTIFFCFCKESCCPGAGGSTTGVDSNFGGNNGDAQPSPVRRVPVQPRKPKNVDYGNDDGFYDDVVSKPPKKNPIVKSRMPRRP